MNDNSETVRVSSFLPPPDSSRYNQEEAEGMVEKRRMLLGLWTWMEKITYTYDIQDV